MGNMIIKPVQEEDMYVLWSTYTDLPICWGSKKKFRKWKNKDDYSQMLGDLEPRLERADQYSTSSLIERGGWYEDLVIIYRGNGFLYRSQLWAVLEILEKNDFDTNDPEILKMLHERRKN